MLAYTNSVGHSGKLSYTKFCSLKTRTQLSQTAFGIFLIQTLPSPKVYLTV